MKPRTVIVGGGLAGLAAATALVECGVEVTLLESRAQFGGRASSFFDRTTGMLIDNCQHVSMGCCTNFRRFWERVGLSNRFRREREIYFVGPPGTNAASVCRFSASRWPAPFHLLSAFRRLNYLSRADRRAIQRGLKRLCRADFFTASQNSSAQNSSSQSFLEWLHEQRQPQTAIDYFWHVVLVSALSETLDRIDIGHARKVFRDGFLANRHGWEIDIPTVPLNELYGEPLQRWFVEHGGTIRLKTGAERVVFDADSERIAAVELRDGEQIFGDDFVLAVPHHRLKRLLPSPLQNDPSIAGIDRLETAPISSVHLWFDRPITELPHAAFVGRLSQWMFQRSVLQNDQPISQSNERNKSVAGKIPDGSCGWYYQVVISASRLVVERSQSKIIGGVLEELSAVWPVVCSATLLHSRVVTEHKAVFSAQPGVDQFRPAQQSPISNLQWAGDWTETGWPATMEGAIRSGFLAAENILARQGNAKTLLQPDSPVSFLSKLLLRL